MTGHEVFDGAHLRATLFAKGLERALFVTFLHRRDTDGVFAKPRPLAKALAAGWGHLYVQARRNDWYINDETEGLIAALSALPPRFTRRVAMGFSMGGYAALRLASAMALDEVVLISPQVSIDPARVPWDRRYLHEARGFDPVRGDLARCPAPGLRGLLLVDPSRAPDLRHARLIAGLFPGVRPVRLGFGGHPATRVLDEGGGVGAIQEALIAGALTPAHVVALHRQARRTSEFYRRKLDEAMAARRLRA